MSYRLNKKGQPAVQTLLKVAAGLSHSGGLPAGTSQTPRTRQSNTCCAGVLRMHSALQERYSVLSWMLWKQTELRM